MVTLLLLLLIFDGGSSWNSNKYLTSFENHECNRDCKYGDLKECYFSLVIDYNLKQSEECKNFKNGDYKFMPTVCMESTSMTINYGSPGPAIEVCFNDTIIVDVLNRILEPTTIHWHGIRQKKTPQMDGVPYLTQYPIQPGQLKCYKFKVDSPGSYWYHSHYGEQRSYGVAGFLIVRQPKFNEPFGKLYDVDTTNQLMFISDRSHNKTRVGLQINGKGYDDLNSYATFQVKKGLRYRFRLVLSGFSQCKVKVSIDNHSILVISSDGKYLQPMQVEYVILTSGERYDFVVKADQPIRNYWIRVKGEDIDCDGIHKTALLHYTNAKENLFPTQEHERLDLKGLTLNTNSEKNDTYDLSIDRARALNPYPFLVRSDFKTYYLHIDMNNGSFTMNGISFKLNQSLSLLDTFDIFNDSDFTCDNESLKKQRKNCEVEECKCAHMIKLPYKELIEVVIINKMFESHPVHLHGYSFYVVGQGDFSSEDKNVPTENLDRITPFPRNINHPPLKDTVHVQGKGYTIIRFYTDNPGYWLFHCHIEWHMDYGMALIFKVGEDHNIFNCCI